VSQPQPSETRYYGTNGTIIGTEIVFGEGKIGRMPYSEADREKTANTRKRGACAQCRKDKKRVRPNSLEHCLILFLWCID
jgi:hypothetical protein